MVCYNIGMFYRRNADVTWRIAQRLYQAGEIGVQEYNAARVRAGLDPICAICFAENCEEHHCRIFPDDPPVVATCGICERSWCEKCDPTPGPLCHFCHGRGWSDAEIIEEED